MSRILRRYNNEAILRPDRKIAGSIRPYKDKITFNTDGKLKYHAVVAKSLSTEWTSHIN